MISQKKNSLFKEIRQFPKLQLSVKKIESILDIFLLFTFERILKILYFSLEIKVSF